MKQLTQSAFKLSLIFVFLVLFNSCEDKSYIRHTYTANIPTKYMSFEELRSAIKLESATELKNPGKIYFKSGFMFINERYKGIHVIDNTNPSSPQNVAFINIPGSVDIAIKGSILYSDSYTDLVAIDISDVFNNNITVTERLENVFSYPVYGYDPEFPVAQVDEEQGVVIEWEVKEITEEIESEYYGGWGGIWTTMEDGSVNSTKGGGAPDVRFNSTGVAGSMARIIIYTDYLYVINNSDVNIIDITDKSKPQLTNNTFSTSRVIETLFINDGRLFIGSTSGMIIYSLSNPLNPTYLTAFEHATACDPVVVSGNYAFVTLRAGNACGGFSNQMDVINITNIMSPYLVKSYNLDGPYGLGVDNDKLFVCDGESGLKVYTDANYPDNLSLVKHFSDIHAYDVIPLGNILMLIGEDGFYQYDYSDLNDMKLLSFIPVI